MKKRGLGVGFWNGVGGKQSGDESIRQAAVREAKEEIGVDVRMLRKMAELQFTDNQGKKSSATVYFCDSWTGVPIESEEMRPSWFNIDEIPYEQMWPDDRYWLPKLLRGDKLTCQFIFDQDNQLISQRIEQLKVR